MRHDFSQLLWPVDRLSDALEQIAHRAGYGGRPGELSAHDPKVEPSRIWMFALAGRLGVELEPITPRYRELPDVVARAAPAVLQVRRDGRPLYLVLLGTRWNRVRLLARNSTVVTVDASRVIALVREEKQARIAAEVDQLLAGVETSGRAGERVREKLLLQRLGQQELRTCWIMRPQRTARARTLIGDVPALMAGILVNHLLLSLVLAFSFWLLGRAALEAHLETGWFEGWISEFTASRLVVPIWTPIVASFRSASELAPAAVDPLAATTAWFAV